MIALTMRYYSSVAGEYALQSAVNASATTISLDTGTGLPSSTPFTLLLDYGESTEEIVTVTSVSGTNLTVTRGEDGTAGQSHEAGSKVRHAVTARDFRDSRTHEAATSAHGVSGNLVGENDAQTLKNKTISGSQNTITNIPKSALPSTMVDTTSSQALTHKTIASPNLTGSDTSTVRPYFTAAATGANNVPNQSWTRVIPLGDAYTSGSWSYSNGEVTVPVAGIYHIDTGVGFEATSSVGSRLSRLLKSNSANILGAAVSNPGTTATVRLNASRAVALNAGDKLQFELYQSSGGTLGMSTDNSATYLSIYWLCPVS